MTTLPSEVLVLEDASLDRGGQKVPSQGVGVVGAGPGVYASSVRPGLAGEDSSLLRCLNRLEDPGRGVCCWTKPTSGRSSRRRLCRRVGMIFQVPVLFPGDVRSNLSYGSTGWANGR